VTVFDSRETGSTGPQLIVNPNTPTAAKDLLVTPAVAPRARPLNLNTVHQPGCA
jgi:hypothetical protein